MNLERRGALKRVVLAPVLLSRSGAKANAVAASERDPELLHIGRGERIVGDDEYLTGIRWEQTGTLSIPAGTAVTLV